MLRFLTLGLASQALAFTISPSANVCQRGSMSRVTMMAEEVEASTERLIAQLETTAMTGAVVPTTEAGPTAMELAVPDIKAVFAAQQEALAAMTPEERELAEVKKVFAAQQTVKARLAEQEAAKEE